MDSTDRLIAAIEAAVEARAPAHPDWHAGVSDALADLERALEAADDQRPADAAMFIRQAMSGLAGIWHDADARDALVRVDPFIEVFWVDYTARWRCLSCGREDDTAWIASADAACAGAEHSCLDHLEVNRG